MNVACIYTESQDYASGDAPLINFSKVPFGLAAIATALKQAGHETDILVFTPENSLQKMLREYMEKSNCRLFCLTAVTSEYTFVVRIAQAIRKIDPNVYTILGGYHASLFPEETFKEDCFDAICIGEGESAVIEYVSQVEAGGHEPAGISNLWISNKQDGNVEKNDTGPFIENLDEQPYLDRRLWERWVLEKTRYPAVLLGRGCPNRCAYCANTALQKLAKGKYVRFRSPDNIVGEIGRLVEIYPAITTILLEAENLSIDTQYTSDLCSSLKKFNRNRDRPLEYGINLQPRRELSAPWFFSMLREANIKFIRMGFESGSERIRQEILKRPKYSNEEIIRFCRHAREAGIAVNLFVMVGIPGESRNDFMETVNCIRECEPQHAYLNIFYPHAGTDLYSAVSKKIASFDGFSNHHSRVYRKAYFDFPGFSRKQIQHEYLLFNYRINRGKLPFYKIGARLLRELLFMSPGANRLYRRLSTNKWIYRLNRRLSTNPEYVFSSKDK